MKKLNIISELREFLVLWSSQAVSALGTAMTNYALIVWVYAQKGTASSITMLTICSFLPSILFRFITGAIADRWDKKRIMLLSDLIAAMGTATVLALYLTSALRIWHLYIINFLLSFMNAFQAPASYVATSLLVPKEHYTRVGGLQAFSGSIVTILAPALGSVVLAFGGLETVLVVDLATFSFAFTVLLLFVRLPKLETKGSETRESFMKSCMAGINFLREHSALLRMILFFAFINFIAKMCVDGMLPAYILGRTGGDQGALGMAQAAVASGILVGSIFVTLAKPSKSPARAIFCSSGLAFLLGAVGQSLTNSLPLWIAFAFISYVPVPVMGANLMAMMRANVPIEMQGRVFSAKDTIQNGTIPLGLFLGGVLADHVFEPFMAASSPAQEALSLIFGTGKGSGIAVMFFIVGMIGFVTSLMCLRNPVYRTLDE